MPENRNKKNSKYGHFSRSEKTNNSQKSKTNTFQKTHDQFVDANTKFHQELFRKENLRYN